MHWRATAFQSGHPYNFKLGLNLRDEGAPRARPSGRTPEDGEFEQKSSRGRHEMLNARAVGRLIATIGHENFEGAFFKLANSSLKIGSCSAFCFKPQQEPMPVILEGGHDALRDLTKALGSQYVKGGFRSDPQIRDLF